MLYLDSSALVKLMRDESETDALRAYVRDGEAIVTSALSITEVLRAVRRAAPARTEEALSTLGRLMLMDVSHDVLERAGTLPPLNLRALDAIHIATALAFGDIDALVTYDARMAGAAREAGLRVAAPA